MNENDFLLLFTTQLKNQDPTQPQDNTAFVSQLAQFSQLEATTSMSTSLNNLISTMQGNGLTNAASLIGQSVSAAGIAANLASGGTVSASISLPSGASSVEVDVYDATNTLVHKETLGSQQPGNLAYTWDGTKTDGSSAPAGQYTLSASAVVGGNPATPTVSINDVIKSVSLSPSTQALELTLQGGSTVPLSSISQILN
jgi:flagellar basal-body rod modification protein FlgD